MNEARQSNDALLEEMDRLRRRIVELETADSQRRRLEADLDLVFRHAPMAICLAGLDGYLRRTNLAYQTMFGRTEQELLSQPYMEFMHPEDRAPLTATVSQLATGTPVFDTETRVCRPDGSICAILWTGIPMAAMGLFLGIGQDITERRQVEHELARNQAMLRATINCLPFNFFAIGPDGRYMMQNATSKRQHQASVIGKRPEDVCPNPEDLAIWQENNRRAFAGEKVEGEVTLSLSGKKRFYYNVVAPIADESELYGILGLNVDITELKEAEAALRKAHDELEQRVAQRTAELNKTNKELAIFRKFAETSGQGFAMAALDTRVTYVNSPICHMCGYDAAEMIGKSFLTFYSEEFQRELETEILPLVLRVGQWVGEVSFRKPSGMILEAIQNIFLIRSEEGEPLCFATVATDISSLKEAEEKVRLSEEKYRMLIEACPDAVVMADPQMRIFFASQQAVRLYGAATEGEICGRTLVDFVVEEERPLAIANARDLLETGLRRNIEYLFLRSDGSRFPCEVSTGVVKGASGKPTAYISIVRDISERKQALERLHKERRTLEHMLRASDHERQLIAYEIHDGLAQELAGAIMQFQVYEQLKNRDPREAAKAYDGGVALLRQSHFEARRLISGVRPPILDESGVVEAVAHLVHEQSRAKGPKIESVSKVQFGRLVPALENAIYRIVQEGLTNACRHSKSKKVRISLVQQGDRIRIEIRDWGIGFQPSNTKEGGYGLAGIRERTRLLGGKCSIQSEAGKGTRITVLLPLLAR